MYRLLVKENGADRVVELTGPVIDIGRGSENQVVLRDPRSSRKHCRLSRTPQGWVLEDLKSRNGTLLNGAGVERTFLKPGDEFYVGNTRCRFEEEGGEERTPGGESGEGEPLEACDFYLEGAEGAYFGKRIPIARLPFTIGRKTDNDFHLEDLHASAHHARIVEHGGRYFLEDLKSRNGTFLNHHRVQRAPLAPGALVRIGDSSFRVELPPALLRAAPEAGAREVAMEPAVEDDFARFDAREFLREVDRPASPLQVAAVLVVLGTILYFAVDVTLKTVRRPELDPSPPQNAVPNWSFEREGEGGSLPGWVLFEGDRGTIAAGSEGARFPGRRALHLTPLEAGLCRAVAVADIPVELASHYRLSAQVMNRGAFAAGVAVSWLGESEGRRVEVGRSWSSVAPQGIDSQKIERTVRPPRSAVFARVMPFAIAAGTAQGGAAFDQVYFARAVLPFEGEGEREEGVLPGGGEGTEEAESLPQLPFELSDGSSQEPAVPGGPSGAPPIRLQVSPSGALAEVRRGSHPLVEALWAGLGSRVDPLALGHRLLTTARQADVREGVFLSAQVPDVESGQWFSLETRVHGQGGEIHCELRFTAKAEGGDPPGRAAVYLEPGIAVRSITAFGGALAAPATFPPERPVEGPLDEVIFGEGSEQIAILFQPAVALRAVPHPEAAGRTLLEAEASLAGPASAPAGSAGSSRPLRLRISPYSRREGEAALALLEAAARLQREGKALEARAALEDLKTRFPWRLRELAQAEELLKGWNGQAERALKEIEAGLEDLEASPSPVIRDSLLARAEAFLSRFRGAPAEPAIRSLEEKVRRLASAGGPEKAAREAGSLLEKAREHLKNGEVGFAELCVRLAQGAKLNQEEERQARHLLGLIHERRVQQAEVEVR